jgi:L-alanine-DL-glutamate epimerase-like enolase superfamily enzyme
MEMPMARIETIDAGFYRIPLPVILSDSTHGEIKAFELLTLRVRDSDGAEGVGYTYTVGRNGGAIADILRREMPDLIKGREADDTEAIWQHVWWGLHYGGRGGPVVLALSALDIALWDLKARRGRLPLWRLLGGFDRRVPCYAGGIDLDLSVEALLKETDDNLSKGFRAIKMKVGRPDLASDVARVRAMRKHLGDGFPLMADANMKWTVEEAIRAARALLPYDLFWLEEPTIPDDIAGHARILSSGGVPIAAGENLRTLWEFKNYIAAGAVSYPEPDVTNCGGVTSFMKIARLADGFNLPVTSPTVRMTSPYTCSRPARTGPIWKLTGSAWTATSRIHWCLKTAWRSRRRARAMASILTGRGWRSVLRERAASSQSMQGRAPGKC